MILFQYIVAQATENRRQVEELRNECQKLKDENETLRVKNFEMEAKYEVRLLTLASSLIVYRCLVLSERAQGCQGIPRPVPPKQRTFVKVVQDSARRIYERYWWIEGEGGGLREILGQGMSQRGHLISR